LHSDCITVLVAVSVAYILEYRTFGDVFCSSLTLVQWLDAFLKSPDFIPWHSCDHLVHLCPGKLHSWKCFSVCAPSHKARQNKAACFGSGTAGVGRCCASHCCSLPYFLVPYGELRLLRAQGVVTGFSDSAMDQQSWNDCAVSKDGSPSQSEKFSD